MASYEINDLNEQTTLNATDELEIQETSGGTSKKTLLSTIRNYILGYVTNLSDKTTPVIADEILINDSEDSNAAKKATINSLVTMIGATLNLLPSASFYGLTLSSDTDTEHDINVISGKCIDSTGTYTIELTSEMTKQIDASWAAGDDAGGLDTGTVAASTWYYIFAILKDSDNSVDVLISASSTAPTMPSGYTYFRRLRGAFLTDSSSNILGFYQKDNRFYYKTAIVDYNTSRSTGQTRTAIPMSVPPEFVGFIVCNITEGDASNYMFGNTQETDTTPSDSYTRMNVDGRSTVAAEILVDSSSEIYFRSDLNSITNVRLTTIGFQDNAEI